MIKKEECKANYNTDDLPDADKPTDTKKPANPRDAREGANSDMATQEGDEDGAGAGVIDPRQLYSQFVR